MTNKAHCGVCDRVCIHKCHQSACLCPDLSSPNRENRCVNKQAPVICETGFHTQNGNGLRVCAPTGLKSISSRSATMSSRSNVGSALSSISSSVPTGSPLLSAVAVLFKSSDLDCPPTLPDLCYGVCFNTKSEHNHCGGCGNFCPGPCIDGSWFAVPTKAPPQLTPPGRTDTTNDLPITPPARPTLTAIAQPVVAYIWRGLAGPQQPT